MQKNDSGESSSASYRLLAMNFTETNSNHSTLPTSTYMTEPSAFSQIPPSHDLLEPFDQFYLNDNLNNNLFQTKMNSGVTIPSNQAYSSTISSENSDNPRILPPCSQLDNCVICGDKASGRHYGVVSCEGCKGFFKRSVRRQVRYVCKDGNACPMDPRKRTRCQYCRFKRCIEVGMRTEAVQEERHTPAKISSRKGARAHRKGAKSTELTIDSLLTAELLFDLPADEEGERDAVVYLDIALHPSPPSASTTTTSTASTSNTTTTSPPPLVIIAESVEIQLTRLVEATSCIPAFTHQLSNSDQLALLKSAWPELLLTSLAYRSMAVSGGLLLASRHYLSLETAAEHGLGPLTERLEREIVSKFRDLVLDRTELVILKAILLFNPDAPDVSAEGKIRLDKWRDELYAGLHSYCTASSSGGAAGSARFTKLLLRLAPLHSISMKCLEYLVFAKLAAEDPSSQRLLDLIERGIWPSDKTQ